jgi:hypothetical protein
LLRGRGGLPAVGRLGAGVGEERPVGIRGSHPSKTAKDGAASFVAGEKILRVGHPPEYDGLGVAPVSP